MNFLRKIFWALKSRRLNCEERVELYLLRKNYKQLEKNLEDEYLLRREFENELRNLEFAENTARAQLMQLRVHGMDVRGRTGYAVTAFIPNEAIESLKRRGPVAKADFVHVVAAELVRLALAGIFNINSRGKVTAAIFADTREAGRGFECGTLFDSEPKIHGLKRFEEKMQQERERLLADAVAKMLPEGK